MSGLVDVHGANYVSALSDCSYDGYTWFEVYVRAFDGSEDRILDVLRISKRYLDQLVI